MRHHDLGHHKCLKIFIIFEYFLWIPINHLYFYLDGLMCDFSYAAFGNATHKLPTSQRPKRIKIVIFSGLTKSRYSLLYLPVWLMKYSTRILSLQWFLIEGTPVPFYVSTIFLSIWYRTWEMKKAKMKKAKLSVVRCVRDRQVYQLLQETLPFWRQFNFERPPRSCHQCSHYLNF